MDVNQPQAVLESEAAELQNRIIATRAHLGETVEALAYKTDIGARTSDAIADTVELAAVRATEVAARSSEALAEAADLAGIVVENVGPRTRRKLLWIVAVFAVVVLALRVRSRRKKTSNDFEI